MREPFICFGTLGIGCYSTGDPTGPLPGGARSVLTPCQHLVVVAPKSSSGASLWGRGWGMETSASDICGTEHLTLLFLLNIFEPHWSCL